MSAWREMRSSNPSSPYCPSTTPMRRARLANDTPYGLAATVWSEDIDVALKTARGTAATMLAPPSPGQRLLAKADARHFPFGPRSPSGLGGRDNGLEALEQYTES